MEETYIALFVANLTGQMLRRALRYRRSKYVHIVAEMSDVGPKLEEKWRRWVEQESFKRYDFGIFSYLEGI